MVKAGDIVTVKDDPMAQTWHLARVYREESANGPLGYLLATDASTIHYELLDNLDLAERDCE